MPPSKQVLRMLAIIDTDELRSIISSKDAYMLIYARKEVCTSNIQTSMEIDAPVPPPRALEVVKSLNAAHDETCEVYSSKYAPLLTTT